jgi:hypothetical protein
MAISFDNIWKDKVLDVLKGILRTEFAGHATVYVADTYQPRGNLSIRLWGNNQRLIDRSPNLSAFTNEYTIDIVYYLMNPNTSQKTIDRLYRDVSHIEQLIFNNTNQSSAGFYNGHITDIDINNKTGDEVYVDGLLCATFNFVCTYTKI